jgi:predicted  nucleic acid-binding Zn-ribbon protein
MSWVQPIVGSLVGVVGGTGTIFGAWAAWERSKAQERTDEDKAADRKVEAADRKEEAGRKANEAAFESARETYGEIIEGLREEVRSLRAEVKELRGELASERVRGDRLEEDLAAERRNNRALIRAARTAGLSVPGVDEPPE